MTRDLVETLSARAMADLMLFIRTEGLRPGDRLPPERVLVDELRVSRNVLREAVAGLRAERKIYSRRGSGVFVGETSEQVGLPNLASVEEHRDVLEFRLAIEVEAAAVAARRRDNTDLKAIWTAFDMLGEDPADPVSFRSDMAFHRAIVVATKNRNYLAAEEQLVDKISSRHRLRYEVAPEHYGGSYINDIREEHHRIGLAIEARDPLRARDAMRIHLSSAIERYARFVASTQRED